MNPRRIVRKIDLANCDQCVERLGSLMFTGDANGHRIELTIEDGGQAADLTGMSARGYFYHVIGGQVNEFAVNGTITGNMAAVTFPPEAYPKGQNKVVFKVEKTGVSIPVYAAMYHVQDADADTVTDPTDTIESLPELLAQIEAMKAATAAANTAAATANQAAQNANDTAAALGVIDDTVINKINPWSSKAIADTFCEEISGSGNPVTLPDLMGRYPLDITAHIEPYQEGSGDPSPDNIRPIVVPTELTIQLEHGPTYTLPLPEGLAEGSVDVEAHNATAERWRFIIRGTEKMWLSSNGSFEITMPESEAMPKGGNSQDICSHAKRIYSYSSNGFYLAVQMRKIVFGSGFVAGRSFGEMVDYFSSENAAGTPVTIVYQTAEPHEVEIASVSVPALPGENVITSNAQSLIVTGRKAPMDMIRIIDRLCLPMTAEGNPVTLDHPVEGYPLDITAHIEPYQEGEGDPSPENVRPIVVPETLELRRTGKNLIALETEILTSERKSIDVPIILPPGYYILSVRNRDGSTTGILPGSTFSVRLICKNGNSRYINNYPNGFYVTEDESKKIISIRIAYSNDHYTGTSDVIRFQLERGTTITPYEPYRGDTYTMALPDGFAGGEVDVTNGTVDGAWETVVLTGDETNLSFTSIGTLNERLVIYVTRPGDNVTRPIFSHGKVANGVYDGWNGSGYIFGQSVGTYVFVFRPFYAGTLTGEPTLENIKAWLKAECEKGTPVTFSYKLDTHTHQTISPVVIPALPGENVITSNADRLTVKARADTPHLMGKVLDRLAAVEAQTTNI